MKKIILILFVLLLAGCGEKKEENLDFRCEKVTINDSYTYKEVVGYYSFEDGEPSKLVYMEDYIPSEDINSMSTINELISKKDNDLSKLDKVKLNKSSKNNKTFVDYTIHFNEKNYKLLSENESYKKYIDNDLFKADVFIEDLVIGGYNCN